MEPDYQNQHQQPQYHPSFSHPSDPGVPQHSQPPVAPTQQPHAPISHSVNMGDKIEQIIMLCYFFVAGLLAFRFALGLFGARQSPFVEFVRDISVPFMIPFEGMFGTTPTVGYYSLEFESLVAIIVYALVFFGLARLVKILFK